MRAGYLVLTIGLVSCGGGWAYTSSKPSTPKPPGCEFEVSATVPQSGYEEIGIIEWNTGFSIRSAADFKNAVRENVCKAGGDLVVSQIRADGAYIRGAVFRKVQ